MYSYFFDYRKTRHPITHSDIHKFQELPTLKMFFLLFLARKSHHIAYGKIARKDVITGEVK